jgi:hypothetical protein
VGQDSQEQVAAPAPMAPGTQRRAQIPLQHRKDRFDLRTFPIRLGVEARFHQSSIWIFWQSTGDPDRSPGLGWDRRADAVILAQETMVVRRVEAGIADHVLDLLRSWQLQQYTLQFGDIGRGPDAGDGRQNRVRGAVDDEHQLAVPLVAVPLFRPFFRSSAGCRDAR